MSQTMNNNMNAWLEWIKHAIGIMPQLPSFALHRQDGVTKYADFEFDFEPENNSNELKVDGCDKIKYTESILQCKL